MNKRRRPRDPNETASYSELKMYYKEVVEELDECTRQRRALEGSSRGRRIELQEAQGEAKKAQRNLVTMTQGEAKKAQ